MDIDMILKLPRKDYFVALYKEQKMEIGNDVMTQVNARRCAIRCNIGQ